MKNLNKRNKFAHIPLRYRTFVNKTLLLLATASMTMATQAATIEVTTTQDQNGEDAQNCSLREAVHAALAKQAFGGCNAGQRFFTDVIKLKEGTYLLNSEIEIIKRVEKFGRSVRIDGADSIDPLKRDSITGRLGKREQPKSIIRAANGNRLFNSLRDNIGLIVNNVIIDNAGSNNIAKGGAFLVGGSLNLDSVYISNAKASNAGGVIFLEGSKSSLNMNNSVIKNSQAAQGAVLSQVCSDNLQFNARNITINNSSIVLNKATGQNGNILDICGVPKLSMQNVTMSDNQGAGAVIDLSQVTQIVSGSKLEQPETTLSNITLINNSNGIAYNHIGNISIKDSVVAFNKNKDCLYSGSKALNEQSVLSLSNNLLTGSDLRPATNACQQPQIFRTSNENKQVVKDSSNKYEAVIDYTKYFYPGVKDYGLGLLGYLPKNEVKIITPGDKVNCKGVDKRGLSKTKSGSVRKADVEFTCAKGAIDPASLFAKDDNANSNSDYGATIKRFEDQIAQKPSKTFTAKQLAAYNNTTKQLEAQLAAYKLAYANKSRVVFADILSNDTPLELVTPTGSQMALFPLLLEKGKTDSANNYRITTQSLGTATLKFVNGQLVNIVNNSQNNVVCEWNSTLNELMIYRKDNTVTPAGQFDFCQYTITHIATNKSATAVVQAKIDNKAPIAKNLEIATSGNEKEVVIDLTQSVNDNADGPLYKDDANLYVANETGALAYVQIIKKPELGSLKFAGDPVACPIADQVQVGSANCYAGKMTYVRDNTLSKFDDSFTYKVYDCGEKSTQVQTFDINKTTGAKENIRTITSCDKKTALASKEATVSITTPENKKKTAILSGGGAFGGLGLFFLIGLSLLSPLLRLYQANKN